MGELPMVRGWCPRIRDPITRGKFRMIGQTISHYRILEKLAAGGMGIVYKAEDTALKRTVALKFLPPEFTFDAEAKQRFLHEAQAASALDHPNICTVYDVGQTDDGPAYAGAPAGGQTYIIMAYYEGQTISEKIKASTEDRGLKIEDGIDIAIQVCQGLSRAHEAGIIHRDIKPANIMLTARGEVKILDFGLAKLAGQSGLTKTGTTLGTAAYMSPEQARSEAVDRRSDIWSLGVVLYQMLAGRLPFPDEIEQARLYSILNEDPTPLRKINPKIPEALEQIVQKSMAKKPEARYQTADELLADLKVVKGGEETVGVTLAGQLAKKAARRKVVMRVGIGVAVAVIVVVAYLFLSPILLENALASNPKTILIIPFENQTGDRDLDNLEIAIQDQLITSLEQSKYFRVVTRQRITDLLKQMGRQREDRVDHSLALELCRREGAEVIVEGIFTKAGTLFVTTAKLLDVNTLGQLRTVTANGQGAESYLLTQIDKLGKDISSGFGIRRKATEEEIRPVADILTSSMEAYQLYLRGTQEGQKYQFVDARHYLEMAVQRDSLFFMAWCSLAGVYTGLYDWIAVERANKKIIALTDRASEKERILLAFKNDSLRTKVMGSQGAPDQEFARFAMKRYPKDKEVLLAAGAYTKVLELDPENGAALNKLMYLYRFKREDLPKCVEAFNRYAAVSPGDPNPFDTMGEIYFFWGMLDEAIPCFETAHSLKSDWIESAHSLSSIYFLREDYTKALRWCDSAIARSAAWGGPRRAEALGRRAFQLFWLGRLNEAQSAFAKYAALLAGQDEQKSSYTVSRLEAWIAFDRGRIARSRKVLERLNTIPGITSQFCIGMIELKEGRLDSVKIRLSTMDEYLASVSPTDSSVYARTMRTIHDRDSRILRGELFLAAGDVTEALEVAPKGSDHDEGIRPVSKFMMNGNLPHAGAPRPEPIPLMVDLLPRSYAAAGNIDSAIASYERAVDPKIDPICPIFPRYHYRLAQVYEQAGMKEKAIAEYEKFLKIWRKADPIYKELAGARMRLAKLKRVR
jgi:eukaryotic-like serine/threonine-protein kinase